MTNKTYKVHNWSDYNQSLINRGSLTLWINDEVVAQWLNEDHEVRKGARKHYSDSCIQCAVHLRLAFGLSLRATKGFIQSIFELLNVNLPVPCYSTISRRQATIELALHKPLTHTETMDLALDSTGFKIYGEGEWKTRVHGYTYRRTWRKYHVAINPETQQIEAVVLTENDTHDGEVVDDLIDQIDVDVNKLYADGAYASFENYELFFKKGAQAIVPTPKNAKIKQHAKNQEKSYARDDTLRVIRLLGRKLWKKASGYHTRNLVETCMYRLKSIFGDKLYSRNFNTQTYEVIAMSNMLNTFTSLGMPKSKMMGG